MLSFYPGVNTRSGTVGFLGKRLASDIMLSSGGEPRSVLKPATKAKARSGGHFHMGRAVFTGG